MEGLQSTGLPCLVYQYVSICFHLHTVDTVYDSIKKGILSRVPILHFAPDAISLQHSSHCLTTTLCSGQDKILYM